MRSTKSKLVKYFWYATLISVLIFNMAGACSDDGGGDGADDDEDVSSVECNGESKSLGTHCKQTYQTVVDCCDDADVSAETATTLVCGMEVNEDACEQGGATAASAQCDLLAMRPDCTAGGTDSESDTGTDENANAHINESCEGECTSEEHMDAFCVSNTKSCMCVADASSGITEYSWVESDCTADASWCTDLNGTPECQTETGACGCNM
jgi:hypothetical protein